MFTGYDRETRRNAQVLIIPYKTQASMAVYLKNQKITPRQHLHRIQNAIVKDWHLNLLEIDSVNVSLHANFDWVKENAYFHSLALQSLQQAIVYNHRNMQVYKSANVSDEMRMCINAQSGCLDMSVCVCFILAFMPLIP